MPLSHQEFNALVQDHGPALYRTAYRMVGDAHLAEDLVQESFRSAWRSRNQFELGRADRAWLLAILRRRIVDHWRRPALDVVFTDKTLESESFDVDPLAHQYSDEMQRALAQLSVDLRETLLLVVVGELTHQETADLLDLPLGTVLSRVSRARERLRELLLAEVHAVRSDAKTLTQAVPNRDELF